MKGWLQKPSDRIFVAVVLLFGMGVVATLAEGKWQAWRMAKCQSPDDIVQLLGPSSESFPPGDDSWKDLCQSWGCHTLFGKPGTESRAELHAGSWFWTGYLVFYEDDTIVAVYRLGIG